LCQKPVLRYSAASPVIQYTVYRYPAWCHFIWLFYLHNCTSWGWARNARNM
jgi:hypothetical protein